MALPGLFSYLFFEKVHGPRKIAEFHNFENFYQCTAKLLSATAIEFLEMFTPISRYNFYVG